MSEEAPLLRVQIEKQSEVLGKEYDLKQEHKNKIKELEQRTSLLEEELNQLRQQVLRLTSTAYQNWSIYI